MRSCTIAGPIAAATMLLLAATSTAGPRDGKGTALSAAAMRSGPSLAAKASVKPQVVCITIDRPPRGVYRRKPHRCEFHHRNSYPIAPANTKRMTHIRWNGHWGQQRAIGRGKLATSPGHAPTKVTLRKPRHVCGHDVFTRASFVIHVHYNGERHTRHFHMPLDDCLV